MPKVGLVLGVGGFTAHAYHCGVLAGLKATTGWDPRDATRILGTSAGSGVGAPVVIDGERLIDGGFRSPTNADLFAGEELVVVSASMAGTSATVRAQRNLRGLPRCCTERSAACGGPGSPC